MWMRYAEDFDIPEVARAIGKSGVATRVLLLRARAQAAKGFGSSEFEGGTVMLCKLYQLLSDLDAKGKR